MTVLWIPQWVADIGGRIGELVAEGRLRVYGTEPPVPAMVPIVNRDPGDETTAP